MVKALTFFLLSVLLASAAPVAHRRNYMPDRRYPYFTDGLSVGNLTSTANWQEISGLARPNHTANQGYLWLISDSPANMLAAISVADASNQGVWTLTGAPAFTDWEDISSARVGGIPYLYVADFGDNGNARATFNIFRIVEPVITGSNSSTSSFETITCAYPAGSLPSHKDAELLLVDPDNGDMYVVTKREAVAGVYYLAHASSYTGTQTLTDLGNMFDIPDVTTVPLGATACNVVAGCISSDGREIIVKNYDKAYYFARPSKSVSIYTTLTQTPVEISYVGGGSVSPKKSHPSQEPQGESICFSYDGNSLFTASEFLSTEGSTSTRYPLFKYDRIRKVPTTVTFQEGVSPTAGYTGTLDTYIWDTNPSTDNGGGVSMVVDTAIGTENDQRKGLLKFDISAIPTSARVVSAQLDLYINTEGQGFKFHKMLVSFVESSTYNSLTGGIDNDGAEAAVAADCMNGINLDTVVGTVRNNMVISTVQEWVSNPSTNFGWMIEQIDSSTGDGVQFDTSEGVTSSRRPKLTIKYYQ